MLFFSTEKIDSPFGEVAASSAAAAAHNCPRPVIHLLFIQILCFAMRLAIVQPSSSSLSSILIFLSCSLILEASEYQILETVVDSSSSKQTEWIAILNSETHQLFFSFSSPFISYSLS